MIRKTVSSLIVASVLALAAGCSTSPRDYSEYSNLQPGQPGTGDELGTSIVARDSESGSYIRAANPRKAAPRQSNLATVPQE
ncbi:MAG TPA: hypothetical protein VGQ99_05215 [Tepidisphaeraceae bacterium]|jgi:hypothetical protein|nr:hypothetical protein [Tepidisphaeraceae bacterium]HEV8604741.1 hypothetical protein [Tepidisphaeraceae bacterium]